MENETSEHVATRSIKKKRELKIFLIKISFYPFVM
jgi:hypothetical protein